MPPHTIAIAGANGKLATLITMHLLTYHPMITIHAIARTPTKIPATILASPNVKPFTASASDVPALRTALRGVTVAICAYLGDDELMVQGQTTLIAACIAEQVPRYVASDWSFDYRGLQLGEHPAKDAMIRVNTYLEDKERRGLIKGVHVLNGAFMEMVLGPFNPCFRPGEGVFRYWGSGEEGMEMTAYVDAAAFTGEVAVDEGAVGFLNVLGDRKNVRQVAEAYERVYGQKLKLERMGSLEDLKRDMVAALEEAPEDGLRWKPMFYLYHMLSGKTWLKELQTSRYPSVKPGDVEAFFRSHAQDSLSSN